MNTEIPTTPPPQTTLRLSPAHGVIVPSVSNRQNGARYVFKSSSAITAPADLAVMYLHTRTEDSGNSTQILLSGDPQQLSPIIRNVAHEPGLQMSYLERLMDTDIHDKKKGHSTTVVKLVKNY
ncbi:hypothetical protein PILCRDRAFT_9514 [Piloderma croceum F 1598]|uniref:RNA helicase n=1 Tax=Piloderma croceum (strain F 1598) TaxID=765440 RepID=A0A0C3B265_PILCF|nr:hypothetical protein PILCRDRAFT_9514 [Piloderma croceum F 1598]